MGKQLFSNSKKTIVHTVIPEKVKAAIDDLGLSNIMRSKAFKLIRLIFQNSMYRNHDLSAYISLPAHYLEKIFNKEYHTDFFNRIKEAGIVECNGKYKKGTKKNPGYSFGYRINQQMIDDKYVPVFYTEKKWKAAEKDGYNKVVVDKEMTKDGYNNFSDQNIFLKNGGYLHDGPSIITKNGGYKTDTESKEEKNGYNTDDVIYINREYYYNNGIPAKSNNDTDSISNSTTPISSSISLSQSSSSNSSPLYHISTRFFKTSLLIDDLSSLKYSKKNIYKATKLHCRYISTRLFTADQVKRNYFKVINVKLKISYDISKKSALIYAADNGVSLIQDGRYFYFDNYHNYIRKKKRNIMLAYKWQMAKMKNKIFFAGRNDQNTRLDHNLTTAGKHIMKVIKEDNDLIEIDIKNSQFAIHAYWMKQKGLCCHEDVQQYYNMASGGVLYDDLGISLKVKREVAKEMMMEVGFSKPKNNTSVKATFRKNFPNVVAHIDDFKKDNYKLFSNELQKIEAEIFVDNLYPNIKELGIFCLTKHDSIIIKRKDREQVVDLIGSYFNHLEFECVLDIEGEAVKINNLKDAKTLGGGVLDTQNCDEIKIESITSPATVRALNEAELKVGNDQDENKLNQNISIPKNEKEKMKKKFTVDGLLNTKPKEMPAPVKPPTKLQHLKKTDEELKLEEAQKLWESLQDDDIVEEPVKLFTDKEIYDLAIEYLKADNYKIDERHIKQMTRLINQELELEEKRYQKEQLEKQKKN